MPRQVSAAAVTPGLAAAVVAAALLAAACATKVVNVEPAGDGGCDGGGQAFPAPFCVSYPGEGSTTCTTCYDRCANPGTESCVANPVEEICVVRADAQSPKCLYCDDPSSGTLVQRTCLRCAGNPAADVCLSCEWGDGVGDSCRRCFDASGAVVLDNCDSQRPERLQ
jgi:hypothetical protein